MRAVSRRDQRRGERGQSLAELSLIAPVLVVILVGIAQLGAIIYGMVTVDTAVREGGRVATEQPNYSGAYTNGNSNNTGATCPTGSGATSTNPVCKAVWASAGMLDGRSMTITTSAPSGTPVGNITRASCNAYAGSVADGYVQVTVSYNVPVFGPFLDQLLATSGQSYRTISATVINRVEPCAITAGK